MRLYDMQSYVDKKPVKHGTPFAVHGQAAIRGRPSSRDHSASDKVVRLTTPDGRLAIGGMGICDVTGRGAVWE